TQTYDAQGRVASVTNRNGLRRELSYDAAGRETSEVWYAADGTTVVETFTFTYTADGKLASASNSEGTYSFTYDAQGRLAGVAEPFDVGLDFTYDARGNRTGVQDSFGGTTRSAYDGSDRLVSRTYSAAGGAAVRVDQEYDSRGRLVHQSR